MYEGAQVPANELCSTYVNGGGGGQSSGNCYIGDTQLNAGPYVLTAVYSGDVNYVGSSSLSQDLTIAQVVTQMQVFPVPGYAIYGAENGNFFIVGVGGNNNNGNASGSVSITADGVSLVTPGTCPANNGGGNPCYIDSATALPASTTPYSVTLSYPGDANFLPSSATVPLSVYPATSSASLAVSTSSISYGSEGSVRSRPPSPRERPVRRPGPSPSRTAARPCAPSPSSLRARTRQGELPAVERYPAASRRVRPDRVLPR